MKATQQLEEEHEGIDIMLDILGRVCRHLDMTGNLGKNHFFGILDFLKVFVDKCHHSKEEMLLIPAMEAAGAKKDGTLSVILHEHKISRGYVRAMDQGFKELIQGNNAASQKIIFNSHLYISLMKEHIEKENNYLFRMADSLLTEEMQDLLFEGFEKIEEEQIGAGRHEKFHEFLEILSGIYLT